MNKNKRPLDDLERELKDVLIEMLDSNESIALRRVVEKCPNINSGTTITRDHKSLRDLYMSAKQEQLLFRKKIERAAKTSRKIMSDELAKSHLKNVDLEEKLQIVISAFIGVIRASGEFGGASAWIKLYDEYKSTLEIIQSVGGIDSAEIIKPDFFKVKFNKDKK